MSTSHDASPDRTTNWAGNVQFRPGEVACPRTIDELKEVILRSEKVRVVGSRHSFNPIVDTPGTWIDLSRFEQALNILSDTEVEVPAAMKLRELNDRLAARGRALDSIGDIDEQQVGGLIATATHGSGLGWGTMSDFVTAVKLVDGRGKERDLREGTELAAARTNLGALGAVVTVTLRIGPAHRLERRRWKAKIEEVLTPEFLRAHDHVQLFHLPFTERVYVRTLQRTERPASSWWVLGPRRWLEWFKENCGVELLFALSRAGRNPGKIPKLMATMERMLAEGTDVGPSCFQMTSKRWMKYHELEMALDLEHLPAAFAAVREVIKSLAEAPSAADRYFAHLPVTIRAVKGVPDNLLSPTLGRDTVYLSVAARPDIAGYKTYFRAVEKVLSERFGARPHWAKHHWINPVALYPGVGEFCRIRGEFDPERKFLNTFVESRLSEMLAREAAGQPTQVDLQRPNYPVP